MVVLCLLWKVKQSIKSMNITLEKNKTYEMICKGESYGICEYLGVDDKGRHGFHLQGGYIWMYESNVLEHTFK